MSEVRDINSIIREWALANKIDPKEAKAKYLEKLKIHPFLSYKAHPIQRAFHKSDKRIRWFLGGNRSGKTRAGAQEVIWWATGLHPFKSIQPPVEIWAVSLDFPTSRDVVQRVIRHLIGQKYLKRWYEADRIVELNNGSMIGFKSVDAGWFKFQGTAKDLIWFDEEPSYDVYKECLMRVVDKKGHIIGTMTPTHGMTWVMDEIYEPWENGTAKDIECFTSSIYENPHIRDEEKKFIEDKFYDEEREARLTGRFVAFSGLIYKDFNPNIHLVNRFPIPHDWTKYRAIDPGVNNPTACIWWAVDKDNNHYIYDEYYKENMTVEENAINIKAQTGDDDIIATYIDPSSGNRNMAHPELRSVRDEYTRFDLFTIPANNDVSFGINKVKELLKVNPKTKQPRLFIFNDCFNTIKEIKRYRWDKHRHHKEEKSPKEKPAKVMDHLMDALRYIAASDPHYIQPYYDMYTEDDGLSSNRKYTKYG